MDYKQLRYNLEDAITTKTPSAALADIKQQVYDFQVSHCAHPKTIFVTSPDTGKRYPLEVPCGRCYHCIETKQNEWVTRMWHETSAHTNCYFVTLTYERYEHFDDIPVRLSDAFWHYDNLNSTGRFCWQPCLCRLEHFQYFIRNLRNDLAASGRERDVVFFMSQEYGHLYGAPHFHTILWTDNVISEADISKAWSVRKGRKYMKVTSIGRIELDNLSTNGTILKDKTINIDGSQYSAKHAFKYVAKYVTKQEDYNTSRLMFFVEHMKKNFSLQFFNPRVLSYYIPNFNHYVQNHVENPTFAHSVRKLVFDLLFPITKGLRKETAADYREFLMPFRPSTSSSRARGIGAVYVKTNLDSLVQGRLAINDPDLGSLVFPSFYFRKVKEAFNPFEFRSRSSGTLAFSKGLRPKILADLQQLVLADPFDSNYQVVKSAYTLPYEPSKLQQWLRDSTKCFRIADTGERGLFLTRCDGLSEYVVVQLFAYNRVRNLYLLTREMPLFQFVDLFQFHTERSLSKAIEQISKAWDSWRDRVYIEYALSPAMQSLEMPSFRELKLEQVKYQDHQRIARNTNRKFEKLLL